MSFKWKLIFSITLLVAITFGVGGSLLISISFQSSLQEEKTNAMESYEIVRNTLSLINSYNEKADYEAMSEALDNIDKQGIGDWQALYLRAGDEKVYLSGSEELLMFDLPVPASDKCSYMINCDNYGHNLQIMSIITADDDPMILKARYDLSVPYVNREKEQKLFLLIYIIVVLIGIVIATVMSLLLTKRLKRLMRAVKQISDGDLSVRSEIKTNDEFGQLSRNFDTMADKLQENIYNLEEEMERQDSFMGAFAHELKTPMTSIIGYADLLRQGGLEENDRISAANYIYSEGKRLEKLSFKLLDLMLMEKDIVEMKEVNLESLLTYIRRTLAPVMKKKNIKLICKSEKVMVFVEPDLVKSLLFNLVDNAAKACGEEGFIVVTGKANREGCLIQVVDNGRGMEEAELCRITEAFYRVDKSRSRKQGGAGLGLSLCKKIVELHNGCIKFSSIPGKGTCASVELYGKGL
ncbi:MAG: sensor histidine kinase [Lachnospiraceae bacterium]